MHVSDTKETYIFGVGLRLRVALWRVARVLCLAIAVWSAAGSSGGSPLPVAVQFISRQKQLR